MYALTASGRITYPDDEIVYQTTASLWEDGDLSVEGIQKRTGEREDRPDGSFGWEYGTDGERYGFFGHGLSVAALPLYGLGKLAAEHAPQAWAHAPRRDLFSFHERSREGEWTRLAVTLTNCLLTPIAAWVLGLWIVALGFSRKAAVVTAVAYAFGTSAWPYTSTFLSEPLSALCTLSAALLIARFHNEERDALLWGAGAIAGFSVHVHLLNFLALPCLLVYAVGPAWRAKALAKQRRALVGALVLAGAGVVLLGVSQQLRFGSAFETGRYDNYGHFTWPLEAMAAQIIGPGRSFLLYSPAILVGLWGWRRLREQVPDAAWLCVAIILLRWVFVSARSDWYGGWGIGPRYLVAVIPFALLPLAARIDPILLGPSRGRRNLWIGLGLCFLLEAWLAAHSIFEHMWTLMLRFGDPEYFARSHWSVGGSPVVGFWELQAPARTALLGGDLPGAIATAKFDMLAFGALRLANAGHPSLLWVVVAAAAVAVWAALRVRAAVR